MFKKLSFRLFDVLCIKNWEELLNLPIETISSLRDSNKIGNWCTIVHLLKYKDVLGIDIVPYLKTYSSLTLSLTDTYNWLLNYTESSCPLSPSAIKKSEGVVIRNNDRSKIAKLRFQDYLKVLK